MASVPHVGASGFAIRITVTGLEAGETLVGALIKQVKLKPPTGAVRTVTASYYTDGTDNKIQIVTVSTPGDDKYLGEAGEWRVQGYVEMPGWSDHTDTGSFYVKGVLA